jgi:hypothetical protein
MPARVFLIVHLSNGNLRTYPTCSSLSQSYVLPMANDGFNAFEEYGKVGLEWESVEKCAAPERKMQATKGPVVICPTINIASDKRFPSNKRNADRELVHQESKDSSDGQMNEKSCRTGLDLLLEAIEQIEPEYMRESRLSTPQSFSQAKRVKLRGR